ncbi:hypothetical protein SBA2_640025 [Acidobacteriia bacterium SbA2]|nr:hypothetical protein SBA2_640025 [Acidobacteriia bacterium SbA2]
MPSRPARPGYAHRVSESDRVIDWLVTASLARIERKTGERVSAHVAVGVSQNEKTVAGKVPFRNLPVTRPIDGGGHPLKRVGLEIDGHHQPSTHEQRTSQGSA